MNAKINTALLVIALVGIGFLTYQQFKIQGRVEKLEKNHEEVSITPVTPGTESPFDKPMTDPASRDFPPDTPSDTTSMQFDKLVHNFGKINDREHAKTTFRFKNTGKTPLVITAARGSCGCTVADYPRDPIKPGASSEIKIDFDPAGKKGETDKTVTIQANTNPNTTVLTIKATVIPTDK